MQTVSPVSIGIPDERFSRNFSNIFYVGALTQYPAAV